MSFLIRDIPTGLMSTWLRDAAPGTMLDMIGPAGAFYLRDISRPTLFLAGGTGLAPFLSMLGQFADTGAPHPIHMVYGVTNDADLVEVETLADYAVRVDGFSLHQLCRCALNRSPAHGLCHRSPGAGRSERRRCGHLPVRPAGNGRRR